MRERQPRWRSETYRSSFLVNRTNPILGLHAVIFSKLGDVAAVAVEPGQTVEACESTPDQHLLRVRNHDLDRIRMKPLVTSVERFECSRRRFCGLRSAFHVADVNSPLEALERCPSELSRFLKKLTWYVDITRLLNNALPLQSVTWGKILIWIKKATGVAPQLNDRAPSPWPDTRTMAASRKMPPDAPVGGRA